MQWRYHQTHPILALRQDRYAEFQRLAQAKGVLTSSMAQRSVEICGNKGATNWEVKRFSKPSENMGICDQLKNMI